jgi:hypothetical protein
VVDLDVVGSRSPNQFQEGFADSFSHAPFLSRSTSHSVDVSFGLVPGEDLQVRGVFCGNVISILEDRSVN